MDQAHGRTDAHTTEHLDRRPACGRSPRRARRRPDRAARAGARRHEGRLLLALREPARVPRRAARHVGAEEHRRGARARRARGRRPAGQVPAAGMLAASRQLLPIDLAVRDWSRRDPRSPSACGVSTTADGYLRTLFGEFCPDEDDVEARSMLAFSLWIGDHFMAADHGGRSRAEVLEVADAPAAELTGGQPVLRMPAAIPVIVASSGSRASSRPARTRRSSSTCRCESGSTHGLRCESRRCSAGVVVEQPRAAPVISSSRARRRCSYSSRDASARSARASVVVDERAGSARRRRGRS